MQWIHIALLSHSAAIATTAIILALALRKKGKTPPDYAFIGMLLMFLAWVCGNSVSHLVGYYFTPSDLLGTLEAWAVLILVLSVYCFCELFPAGTHGAGAYKRITIAAGVSACFLPVTFSKDFISNRHVVDTLVLWDAGPLYAVFGGWATLLVLGGFAQLVAKHRRLKDSAARLHIRIFLAALLIDLIIGFGASYVLPLLGHTHIFFLGPDASMASMGIFIYAILYHRMFDVRSFALRAFVRGALFVAVLGIGYAAYRLLRNGGEPSSFGMLALFLGLLAFGRFAQPRIESALLPARMEAEEIILKLFRGRSVGSATAETETLMDEMLGAIHQAIPSEQAFLLTMDPLHRIRYRTRGPASPTLSGIRPALLSRWQKTVQRRDESIWSLNRILVLDPSPSWVSQLKLPTEQPRLQRLFLHTLEGFRREGYRLFLPLIDGNEFCGFIGLGNKLDGSPYFSADLQMVNSLRLYLALTLRNHGYYEELQQRKQRAEEDVARLTEVIAGREVVRRKVGGGELIYRSTAMQQVLEAVQQAAAGNRPVLITGETGTGKELMAHLIAELGQKPDRPFIAVNCAAIPATLWEDEIFGHVKGAFTDARSDRPGRVAEAMDGILFFDEIGEMPLDMQGKMLRLLQENEYTPVGGSTPSKARCRFIFATNRNLAELIQAGRFRADLYYRISVYPLQLPPLRERKDDIPVIVDYLIERLGPELQSSAKSLHPAAMQALRDHPWEGNVRELENVIIRALSRVSQETVIRLEDLPLSFARSSTAGTRETTPGAAQVPEDEENLNFDDAVRDFSRRLIERALARTRGNKTQAAELLGIGRSKLRYKLRELDLEPGATAAK